MAQKMIDREHPLKNTLIWVTLPYLKPIRRWLPGFIPNSAEDSSSDSENEVETVEVQGDNKSKADKRKIRIVEIVEEIDSMASAALLPYNSLVTTKGPSSQLNKYK